MAVFTYEIRCHNCNLLLAKIDGERIYVGGEDLCACVEAVNHSSVTCGHEGCSATEITIEAKMEEDDWWQTRPMDSNADVSESV